MVAKLINLATRTGWLAAPSGPSCGKSETVRLYYGVEWMERQTGTERFDSRCEVADKRMEGEKYHVMSRSD